MVMLGTVSANITMSHVWSSSPPAMVKLPERVTSKSCATADGSGRGVADRVWVTANAPTCP